MKYMDIPTKTARGYHIRRLTDAGAEALSWSIPETESRADYRAIVDEAGNVFTYCVKAPAERYYRERTESRFFEEGDRFTTASGAHWVYWRCVIDDVYYLARLS